jgi:hypothetical protein
MNRSQLTPEEYAWLTRLPELERVLVVELVRLLDARFIEDDDRDDDVAETVTEDGA